MISASRLQQAYIDLYKQFRNYIWDYKDVEMLANLEFAIFKACPDIIECKNLFDCLKIDVMDVSLEDEDFQQAIDDFSELINNETSIYCPITVIRERIQDEDK